jgi:hypothetical protein
MPRRSGHDLNARGAIRLAALTAVLAVAGCQTSDTTISGCSIAQQVAVPASPLTLLPDARLDRLGADFALLGADADGMTARWAIYDPAAGALGAESSAPVQPGAAGPWLALTSGKAPGDTLLSAFVIPQGNDAELHLTVVPTATPPAAAPAVGPVYAVSAGALANGATPMVALGASRSGPHAVLAWVDPTAGAIMQLFLSAGGEPIGTPTMVEAAPRFACLAFAPGKSALTLVYHKYADATTKVPHYVIKELRDTGDLDSTLELILDGHAAGCPQLTPTDAGYALAFQDDVASWLGVYDDSSGYLSTNAFVAAVSFGGASLQPPLAGLAPAGTDFEVLFDRAKGGELWRITSGGGRRSGQLALPSVQGTISSISSQPDSGSLTATYADYTALGAGVGTAGQRYFVNLACQ